MGLGGPRAGRWDGLPEKMTCEQRREKGVRVCAVKERREGGIRAETSLVQGQDVASARALTHARNGKGAGGLEPGKQGETWQGFGSPVTTGRVVEALVSRRERCGS